METYLKEKIKQYIAYVAYFDAKKNEYSDKNEYQIVEKVCENKNKNEETPDRIFNGNIIGVAWQIGGRSGGNCYDDTIATAYTVDNPAIKDFYLLDDILSQLTPELKYSQYRDIMNSMPIINTTVGEYEYYGNDRMYHLKYFKISDLVNAFDTLNLTFDESFIDSMNKTFEEKKTSKPKFKH